MVISSEPICKRVGLIPIYLIQGIITKGCWKWVVNRCKINAMIIVIESNILSSLIVLNHNRNNPFIFIHKKNRLTLSMHSIYFFDVLFNFGSQAIHVMIHRFGIRFQYNLYLSQNSIYLFELY